MKHYTIIIQSDCSVYCETSNKLELLEILNSLDKISSVIVEVREDKKLIAAYQFEDLASVFPILTLSNFFRTNSQIDSTSRLI